ncbi:MAG: HEAT repeat domain-containing protein [Planctomycetota bacterium]
MRRFSPFVGILIAVMGARTARAEDAEDPGALLRKARTTEAADRDVAAAIPMYRKVMALAPASDAARDAGLRLLELLEQRGEKTAALEVASALTERLSARLDDDAKRKVHEAMARMLPAGSKARSPLGEIYVVPPANAPSAASPLEAKVFALLPRVDAANARNDAREVETVLRDVGLIGTDAVVPLAKILRTERFDHAQFAARGLARIATPEAIGVLVAAVKDGDGFVRTAALAGLREVQPSPTASPAFVKAVAPLLDDPALAASRLVLRYELSRRVDDAEVERRLTAGGADASFWLRIALERQLPSAGPALDRATSAGGDPDDDLVAAIEAAGSPKNVAQRETGPVVELKPGLSPATRLTALKVLVAAPPTEFRLRVAAAVAVGCVHAGDAAVATAAAAAAWPYVLGAPEAARPDIGVDVLVRGAVPLPPAVVEDDVLVAALLRTWLRTSYGSGIDPQEYEVQLVTPPALLGRATFLTALADVAAGAPGAPRRTDRLLRVLARLDPRTLPAASSTAWQNALAQMDGREFQSTRDVGLFALRVACAASDPRALDAVRRIDPEDSDTVEAAVTVVHKEYAGKDRVTLAVDLLAMYRMWEHSPVDARTKFVLESRDSSAFYQALADRLDADADAGFAALRRLLELDRRTGTEEPSAAAAGSAARWLMVLRRVDPATPRDSVAPPAFLLARWAVAGDPAATLALARARALGGAPAEANEVVVEALVNAIASRSGVPGGKAFLVELSKRADLRPAVAQAAAYGLARPGDDGDLARLEEMAASPTGPGATDAVEALRSGGHREALVRIVSGLAGKTVPPSPWSRNLRLACITLRLEEALPWLLTELKGGDPEAADEVAQAIDTIQAHHARIARLEARATATRDARADVEPMLDDPDPDLRVAAILSYGAIAGRDGLPRLLRLAKDEKDPSIRRAILETIDRIAKSPPSAAPPATPEPEKAPRDGK